jgi:hypothetical protein
MIDLWSTVPVAAPIQASDQVFSGIPLRNQCWQVYEIKAFSGKLPGNIGVNKK